MRTENKLKVPAVLDNDKKLLLVVAITSRAQFSCVDVVSEVIVSLPR